ncbi:hypothetical protein CC80DRAFT_497268 [Byssothecium circinans]|uniref:HTH La-type RNA-binding domain-containing protein n=1 Tax=Byssothecium circinans TaxID=147558 RepID=A0A6A5TDD3_9PLEO|nr:hypothetical protein CC80DRAFT_497268 [Byssothecium circinans]
MSDTSPATEAPTNNPAADIKTEQADEVKSEENTEPASDVSMANATDDVKAAKAEDAANGTEEEVKAEESSDEKREEKAPNGRNGDSYRGRGYKNERNGKHGRGSYHSYGSGQRTKQYNSNKEFDNLPESDDPAEICTQVEFYFADHNLKCDEHLFKLTQGPKNIPVRIKELHSFKRMRHFQPYSAVVNALRESDELVVVDDGEYSGSGNEGVKRKTPLVAPKKEEDGDREPSIDELFERCSKESYRSNLARSAYVKNFNGPEVRPDVQHVSQIQLELFFKPYGCVAVRKRRDEEGNYKGSVFVEFDSEESQQEFLALDPKPKFNTHELIAMGKKEYNEMKCKEKGIVPGYNGNSHHTGRGRGRGGQRGGRGNFNNRGRGRGRGDRGRGDRDRRDGDRGFRGRRDRSRSGDRSDADDWNKRRDNFQSRNYKGKGEKRGRDRSRSEERVKSPERDAHGVPVVKDTRTEEEKAAFKKRKAGDDTRDGSPKKSKITILEDE